MMKTIPRQTRVCIEDGKQGVVVEDFMNCCEDNEIPVVWEGQKYSSGTARELLTVIGMEGAIPEPKKCGLGQGVDTCIFLVLHGGTWECQRFGALRYVLIMKNMRAQRHPTERYPQCMSCDPGLSPGQGL